MPDPDDSLAPTVRPGPRGGKRQRNRAARTQQLQDAALALFLEHGVQGTTIDAIADGASMAKGSFYRYFRDKEDLVASLFQPLDEGFGQAMDRCRAALERAESDADLFRAYETLATALIPLLFTRPDVLRLYLQECRGPAVGARRPITELAGTVTARAIALTRVAHEHALLRPIPPEVAALAVVGATERLLHAALAGDAVGGHPLEVGQALISLVLDGVRVSR